jgi:hypothetical protein
MIVVPAAMPATIPDVEMVAVTLLLLVQFPPAGALLRVEV